MGRGHRSSADAAARRLAIRPISLEIRRLSAIEAESMTTSNSEGRVPYRTTRPEKQGLYDPAYEHDACGVGFVVDIKGRKSHKILQHGLQILTNLDHRGACGAEVNTGDGAGVLLQMPHKFLLAAAKKARID